MKTYNFDLRYIEIALDKIKKIDEEEYVYIVQLIGYLQCVNKYSLDFPKNIKFKLPNGENAEEYDELKKWLIATQFFKFNNNQLILTRKGDKFFKKLEKECLNIEETFLHYRLTRC